MLKQRLSTIYQYSCKALILLLLNTIPISVVADEHDSKQNNDHDESTSQEAQSPRIYRNPEERREAGLGTQLTDWLLFSGLLEIEKNRIQYHFRNSVDDSETEPTTYTLQAGLHAELDDWLEATLVFEAEYDDSSHSKLDEGEISADLDDWGIKAGLLNLPFGEYYSYFVTGPMLEFGETRRNAIMLDYSFTDTIELTIFGFNSKLHEKSKNNQFDWGISLEATSDDESIRFGASYISDLAETDEPLLDSSISTYIQQVSAWSAYLLFGFDELEVTLETVQALDEFEEMPRQANKPSATNIELAYFAVEDLQFAVRVANSAELPTQPQWQYGVSASWRALDNMSLSADYLYGTFKKQFYLDEDGNELHYIHQIAAQLAVEF